MFWESGGAQKVRPNTSLKACALIFSWTAWDTASCKASYTAQASLDAGPLTVHRQKRRTGECIEHYWATGDAVWQTISGRTHCLLPAETHADTRTDSSADVPSKALTDAPADAPAEGSCSKYYHTWYCDRNFLGWGSITHCSTSRLKHRTTHAASTNSYRMIETLY